MATYIYPPLPVSVIVPPTSFNLDGANQTVTEDTSTPANNKSLPSLMMIKNEFGVEVPITLDQTSPYANTPLPVCITDITGSAVVNVTAGDLNVKIVHNGADPSSIRLGDGITEVGVTTNNQLKTNTVHNGTTPSSVQIGDGTTLAAVTVNNDIKVKTTHNGTTPSSIQIGDGTTLAGVTVSNELKVNDASISKLALELIGGDVSSLTIDNVTGQTLVTPTAGFKAMRIAQNGGGDLLIYMGATKIGALEKGGLIIFNKTYNGTDAVILKNSDVGSVSTSVSWNLYS